MGTSNDRFQFSLRTLVLAMAYVGFMLAWGRFFWTYHGIGTYWPGGLGMASVGILVFANHQLRNAANAVSAWNWMMVAWLITAANVMWHVARAPNYIHYAERLNVEPFRADVVSWIVAAVTLPMFCTIPGSYVLLIRYRPKPTRLTRTIFIALATATVDAVVFVLAFCSWFERLWS